MKIRMIASDMDGTLLLPSGVLPEGIFEAIAQLRDLGVLFVAASGRQYDNLRHLFGPTSQLMGFICENAGLTALGNEVIDTCPFERGTAMEIIRMLQSYRLRVLVSGLHCCYVLPDDRNFADEIIYQLRNTTSVVRGFDMIDEDIVKISGCVPEGVEDIAPRLIEKWSGRVNAAISGGAWFDFTMAHKGMGIRTFMRRFGLSREEVAVFGDSFNDEKMFAVAGHPFVMQSADPRLRKPGTRVCENVMPVLQSIIAAGGELPDVI